MELPVDSFQEGHLVRVYLVCIEAGYLAPCSGREVSVLKILRSQNERREEHPSATLHGTRRLCILRLLHGKVALRYTRFDQDQIVESYLQCRVARS